MILLDLIFFYLNPVKGVHKYKTNYIIENNTLKKNNFKNSHDHVFEVNSRIPFGLKNQLNKDIINHGNKLIHLLVLEGNLNKNETNNKEFNIDIESDIQYEKNNIYYAEGDVVLYFSNSLLKGDKLIYDKTKKILKIYGNVLFSKGNQYFQATGIFYNLKLNEGFIDNIYGIIDSRTFIDDFEFKDIKKIVASDYVKEVDNLKYINSANLGIVNDFEEGKKFNITKLDFKIPSITKWRYKSDKIVLQNDVLKSKKIFFTNDPINQPQFILKSKNFISEVVDKKIKLTSNESWLILVDKFKFPIGKRTIFEEEKKATWGIGSDFKEKDGFYISRNFRNIKINDDFKFNYEPYFLFQRVLKGNTKSFPDSNASILSEKVKDDINISDFFALDTEIEGNFYSWYLNWQSRLNSLNPDRFSQAFRTKLYLRKSFDLNENNSISSEYNTNPRKNFLFDRSIKEEISNDKNLTNNSIYDRNKIHHNNQKEFYENFLDIEISSTFREKISKAYSGESEIYFGNSINITNRKSWSKDDNYKNINFIYDFGKFKAETKNDEDFIDLYRNVFIVQLGNTFPLLTTKSEDKNINDKYRYTPQIINPGINWSNDIKSGFFLYSNGESQQALSLTSGPSIILGRFKKDILDFTSLNLKGIYVLKNGESPFKFDDINKDLRINLEVKQQVIGPLVFSYQTSYKFEDDVFDLPKYGIDINRRAYSIGAFYDSQNERLGINFSIFNFDYTGNSSKF